jgi:hypothetical protein|nr:MAG TPA: hypothetical protein [Caudoviricetes sp.]
MLIVKNVRSGITDIMLEKKKEVKSNDKVSNRRTSVINDIHDYGNYVDSHGHSTKKRISERR